MVSAVLYYMTPVKLQMPHKSSGVVAQTSAPLSISCQLRHQCELVEKFSVGGQCWIDGRAVTTDAWVWRDADTFRLNDERRG